MKPHPEEAKGLGAIDQMMREKIREKSYAAKTEESYVSCGPPDAGRSGA